MVKKKRVSASEKEYNRLAKNVKAKEKRVHQNYGIDLSNEIKIPNFSELTTKQRKEVKEQMKSFTNRSNLNYQFEKNKYGIVANKKMLSELTRNTTKAQIKTAEHLKEMGEITGKDFGRMSPKEIISKYGGKNINGIGVPSEFNFNNYSSKRSLLERYEKMKERANREYYTEKTENFMNNFIDKVSGAFNSDADNVIEKLKTLSPNEFYELYKKENLDFDWFYVSEFIMADENIELRRIENAVNTFIDSKNINRLKVV